MDSYLNQRVLSQTLGDAVIGVACIASAVYSRARPCLCAETVTWKVLEAVSRPSLLSFFPQE